MATAPARKILTVSQVNALVAEMLDEYFSDLWITGEVSNLNYHSSGHIYFRLKDEGAQIDAACFRSSAQRLKFRLEEGMQVVAHGRLEIYVPSGRYQIILDTIEPRGIGALQQAFEQLKRKLEKEGLFAPERKRPLPRLPRVIGIVTSPSGAAIRDMLKTLRLHRAHCRVLLYPVQVQGEGAAEQIVRALAGLNRRDDVEVIILGRGGGSIEDLWPFNEEIVARAIAASRIPVVTGIGHEVDYTIADFVADYRAATPTAAAQKVAQGWQELEQRFEQTEKELVMTIQDLLFHLEQRIDELSRHRAFEQVVRRVREFHHHAEILQAEMRDVFRRLISVRNETLNRLRERLSHQNPAVKIRQGMIQLNGLKTGLQQAITGTVTGLSTRLARLAGALEALSPLAILARGYALCFSADGTLIKKINQVEPGEEMLVLLSDGRLRCGVQEKIPGGKNGKQEP
ncbi:MAG: exodeoxyribonuclease VII large subunit [candidate division WOR-3 bacterium]